LLIGRLFPSFRVRARYRFPRDWLRKDLSVIGFGLIGWIAPSSIPAINGNSLTGLFFSSIGEELAHFPTPPPVTSQFWLDDSDDLALAHCYPSVSARTAAGLCNCN
jgi:hypothetical protein